MHKPEIISQIYPIAPDLRAATITFDCDGVSENTYSARDLGLEPVTQILNQLVAIFPQALEESQAEMELIGLTQSNGDNYQSPTVSLFFKGPPSPETRNRFKVPQDSLLIDAHTLKFELQTGTSYIKVYEGNWWDHELPALPQGFCLATNFGLGRHYGKAELTDRRDVYFFYRYVDILASWLKSMGLKSIDQTGVEIGCLGLYGLQFDVRNFMPLKIKRYYQPHQSTIEDRLTL